LQIAPDSQRSEQLPPGQLTLHWLPVRHTKSQSPSGHSITHDLLAPQTSCLRFAGAGGCEGFGVGAGFVDGGGDEGRGAGAVGVGSAMRGGGVGRRAGRAGRTGRGRGGGGVGSATRGGGAGRRGGGAGGGGVGSATGTGSVAVGGGDAGSCGGASATTHAASSDRATMIGVRTIRTEATLRGTGLSARRPE